jgi:hypothetical protein
VADGKDRTWYLLKQAGDIGGVGGDCEQRIRAGRDRHALCLESLDHGVPARSIGKRAVHQHEVVRLAVPVGSDMRACLS